VKGPAEQQIQWYPGHMAAALRQLERFLPLIDVVIEVVDARVPRSGMSTVLTKIAGRRPRLIVLTREDLADPQTTLKWLMYFKQLHEPAVAVNGTLRRSVKKIDSPLRTLATRRRAGVQRRAIIVGIPNSGKSTVINALAGRRAAATENRPGRTRGVQWIRLQPSLELMDTPGILAPKIESAQAQWMLAMTGAIPSERYDPEEIVARFTSWLKETPIRGAEVPDLATFAASRGTRTGGNLHNAARSYIKAFNEGRFGRMTLEVPPHDGKAA